MRLGQILVAAGRLSPAQLDEALRSQVLYGGRLGTNLVELGHCDLDGVAMALARQHGIPAALLKHFERCDLTVQARLPAALAARWRVIPIGHLADRRNRIAVAALDPLPRQAIAEIAAPLGCAPEDLVLSVAGELRVHYYLERCYGIPRESRFLRIRRASQIGVPLPPPDDEIESVDGVESTEPTPYVNPFPDAEVDLSDLESEGEATVERPPFWTVPGAHVEAPRGGGERPLIPEARGWRTDSAAPMPVAEPSSGPSHGVSPHPTPRTPRPTPGRGTPGPHRAPTPARPSPTQARPAPTQARPAPTQARPVAGAIPTGAVDDVDDAFASAFDLGFDENEVAAEVAAEVEAALVADLEHGLTDDTTPFAQVAIDLSAEEPARHDARPAGVFEFEVEAESSHRLAMLKERAFVRTLSDGGDADDGGSGDGGSGDGGLGDSGSGDGGLGDFRTDAPGPAGTLARIPLRKMAPAREDAPAPTTFEEALRAVRRARSRDRVGELVAAALTRFTGLEVGAVFVIRDPVAIGWKSVVRGNPMAIDSLAVALDQRDALLASACQRDGVVCIERDQASSVDRRLWRALGCGEPDRAMAARVLIGAQPVGLLYVQGECAEPTRAVMDALVEATAVAVTRLLRAAQR